MARRDTGRDREAVIARSPGGEKAGHSHPRPRWRLCAVSRHSIRLGSLNGRRLQCVIAEGDRLLRIGGMMPGRRQAIGD